LLFSRVRHLKATKEGLSRKKGKPRDQENVSAGDGIKEGGKGLGRRNCKRSGRKKKKD